MAISTRIFAYIDEVRTVASTLNSVVSHARSDWYDGNYERIAEATASQIVSDANSFCGSAQSDAQMVYNDMVTIETIINDL